jgi:ribokinase
MSLLIVGSLALDSVRTPFGEKKEVLGGSAVYAAVSASFFVSPKLVGPIGRDFPEKYLAFLKSCKIDLSGLQRIEGMTFRWEGYYEYDMNQAHTLETQLNVLAQFDPRIPESFRNTSFVFLANLDPELQLKVIAQLEKPKLLVADTMNYWIERKREALHEVIKKVDFMLMNDAEIRQFMETPNIPLAARRLIKLGCKGVIVKKGEHGALLFTDDNHFSAPSYPQELLRDPTGAGDSFAGGFMGYLAKTMDLSEANIRKAVIIGSVMASFNVEDFSLDRLRRLKHKEVILRFEEFKKFSEFEALSVVHWV